MHLLLLVVATLVTPSAAVQWNVDSGTWARGGDAVPAANMTLAAAEEYCTALANCSAFTFLSPNTSTPQGIITMVHFKQYATNFLNEKTWWVYSKPPNHVRTCDASSPSHALPWCDAATKSMAERAEALVSNLTMEEKLNTFMISGMLSGIPRLNIKSFRWDATDIEGVDDQVFRFNNTCFPHAIGLGATFDLELIAEISNVTAVEARVLQRLYWETEGVLYATNYDGGPLANVAYDPRVGRISEMYGEDPYHVSQIGVVATKALQNKTAAEANGDYFLQTSQVTRHFITDHGSQPDNNAGDYWGNAASLEDEYLPPFKAFQLDGEAEGIMYSISSLNGMSSVTNEWLFGKLRNEWKATNCFTQTDCCGTFSNAVNVHKNFNTTEDAVAAAITAGIQLDYGDNVGADIPNAIAAGKLKQSDFDAAVARGFLVRFRLGEFDSGERNPFFGKYDVGLLDSEKHRASARKAAAASMVLLQNERDTLPINYEGASASKSDGATQEQREHQKEQVHELKQPVKSIAVIGPYADCPDRHGGYGGHPCYLHSYNGQPSYVSTILSAIQEVGNASNIDVAYARGCDMFFNSHWQPNATAVAEATALAAKSDVVILALGLGPGVEGESIDRFYLTFPKPQKELLAAVVNATKHSAKTPRTVLAINSAGGVDINVTDVDAIIQVGYAGQETGHGLADLIFGAVSPSARLPLTIHPETYLKSGVGPVNNLNMTFPLVGAGADAGAGAGAGSDSRNDGDHGDKLQGRTYRYLADQQRDALFSFGWGLSYTQFKYSSLVLTPTTVVASATVNSVAVSVSVTNVGKVASNEIVFVWVSAPVANPASVASLLPTPQYALQGFQRVTLAPGASAAVKIVLDREQFSAANADGTRSVSSGVYTISVAGHLPSDPRAALPANLPRVSNVVTATVTI